MGYMCVATFVSLVKEQDIACFLLIREHIMKMKHILYHFFFVFFTVTFSKFAVGCSLENAVVLALYWCLNLRIVFQLHCKEGRMLPDCRSYYWYLSLSPSLSLSLLSELCVIPETFSIMKKYLDIVICLLLEYCLQSNPKYSTLCVDIYTLCEGVPFLLWII